MDTTEFKALLNTKEHVDATTTLKHPGHPDQSVHGRKRTGAKPTPAAKNPKKAKPQQEEEPKRQGETASPNKLPINQIKDIIRNMQKEGWSAGKIPDPDTGAPRTFSKTMQGKHDKLTIGVTHMGRGIFKVRMAGKKGVSEFTTSKPTSPEMAARAADDLGKAILARKPTLGERWSKFVGEAASELKRQFGKKEFDDDYVELVLDDFDVKVEDIILRQ